MRPFPLSRVYGLLESGPVVMVTTMKKDRANIMTMSWHTMMDFEPPLIGCVISNRNYTFNNLKKTKECVISIPSSDLAKTVVQVGNTSGRDIDKFRFYDLTAIPASKVKAPLIKECFVNLECKVVDTTLVNKYNFFILKVSKAWRSTAIKHPRTIHHLGKGKFMLAGEIIKLPSKMK